MVKARELRVLSEAELKEKLSSLKKQLMEISLQKKSNRVEKPHLFTQIKRDIARVLTVLREKRNGRK